MLTLLLATAITLFPQVAVGGGWSCDIFITNQDSRPVNNVTLSFYQSTGPLVVTTNLGNNFSFTFNLAPGATQVVRASLSGGTRIGYAVLSPPEGSSVTASLVFSYKQGSVVLTQIGVPSVSPSTMFSFPAEIDAARQLSTGLAVCYPEPATNPLDVVVSLIDEAGKLANFTTLSLNPGAQLARFLNEAELFPGLQSFRGSVCVSAIQPFGLLALHSEGSSVGSLMNTRSPVVGAFVQKGLLWTEAEPNNSIAAAQLIVLPTRLAGGFSQAGDTDFFAIDGKAGQVLTALTQVLDSETDPALALLKSDGTVIIQNDQNGLPGQKDAFVQARLPADGKYLVRVTETNGNSGAAYTYELHVRMLGQDATPSGARIVRTVPESGVRGNTISLEVEGTDLCPGSLRFFPPGGLEISDFRGKADRISVRVRIDPTALTGPRLLSIDNSNGGSNAVPFQINASGASSPRISGLQVGAPSYDQGKALINFRLNFFDADGDLTLRAGDMYRSARVWFIKGAGTSQCRSFAYGSFLHSPGKTSGTATFTLAVTDYVPCDSEVSLELIDAAGNISNPVMFKPTQWFCGP